MATNQEETKKEFVKAENVHFTTDGNKKIRMLFDYKTNLTDDYILNANLYVKNNDSEWIFLTSEVLFISGSQGCITWEWDALSNLKSKTENTVYLQLKIAKLPNDESIPEEEWEKYEQVIDTTEYVVNVYFEHHFFGKNILEIR